MLSKAKSLLLNPVVLKSIKQPDLFHTTPIKYALNQSLMRYSSKMAIMETGDLDCVPPTEEALKKLKKPEDFRLPHAWYTPEDLENQVSAHHVPVGFTENFAWYSVTAARLFFDTTTGYNWAKHTEKLLLQRVMFLETVAGIPGIIGALNRHLKSLRKIEPDYGWIHTLLEEAENERMHLMTSLLLLRPGWLMKAIVLLTQGFFTIFYTTAYAISPLYCHRFVGYLEEEAFKTYTGIIEAIDAGKLPGFTAEAPLSAIQYWNMEKDSTLRDLFLAIRADENHHRIVNHTFASMSAKDVNPFPPGF